MANVIDFQNAILKFYKIKLGIFLKYVKKLSTGDIGVLTKTLFLKPSTNLTKELRLFKNAFFTIFDIDTRHFFLNISFKNLPKCI